MNKKKAVCVGMNMVAPGFAQYAVGRPVRGTIHFVLSIICFCWATWEALKPLFLSICEFCSDSKNPKIYTLDWQYAVSVAIPVLILAVVWIWSMADIILLYHPEEVAAPTDQEQR